MHGAADSVSELCVQFLKRIFLRQLYHSNATAPAKRSTPQLLAREVVRISVFWTYYGVMHNIDTMAPISYYRIDSNSIDTRPRSCCPPPLPLHAAAGKRNHMRQARQLQALGA